MKPIVKAAEIYLSFKNAASFEYADDAKQCALVAINEILWILNELDHDLPDNDAILFYNEVKLELEKL